jgi:DNA-binding MarR family transcriptional regulator
MGNDEERVAGYLRPDFLRELAERYPTMNIKAQTTFMEVISVLRRLNFGMDTYFQEYGISHAGFKVLINLLHEQKAEGLSPANLSSICGVTRATVTGILDTLENNSWIERHPDPNDRRGLLIQLTDSGRAKLDTILPKHYGRIAQSMTVLSPDEQDTLRLLIQKFSKGLDAFQSHNLEPKKEEDK